MESLTKITLTKLLLITTILMTSVAEGGGRYDQMAERMVDMMDAFASAYQQKRADDQSYDFPYSTGQNWMPGYSFPPGNFPSIGNRPRYPAYIPGSPGYHRRSRLEGSWRGKTGEILVINSGRFRIYQSPERYHEGLIYLDKKHLALRQTAVDVTHKYEYAEQDGRLVLRDARGNLLLYKKIR